MTAWLTVAWLHAAWLYGDVSLGAGVDGNITRAPADQPSEAAGFAEAAALAGLEHALDAGELWLEAGYALSFFPAYGDFTSHALTLAGGLGLDLSDRLTLRVRPAASLLFYGDSARDGESAGGSVELRYAAAAWLVPTLRAGATVRAARDDAFAYDAYYGSLSISLRPAEALDLRAGYTLEATDVTLYLPLTSVVQPQMGMRRHGRSVSGFGSTQFEVRADRALVHSGSASATVSSGGGLYATASYLLSAAITSEPSQDYVDQVAVLTLGVQL